MEDIAATAEEVIKSLKEKSRRENNREGFVKTNQIRKFLSAVTSLTNRINVYRVQSGQVKELSEELAAEVKYLKVKAAYQIGRNAPKNYRMSNPVKDFVETAGLMKRIDDIGKSIPEYDKFAKYIEALVAYHKYYGGKD